MGMPDHIPYRAWSNFEFLGKDGSLVIAWKGYDDLQLARAIAERYKLAKEQQEGEFFSNVDSQAIRSIRHAGNIHRRDPLPISMRGICRGSAFSQTT